MTEKENKMEKLKQRLIRLHDKIHNRVEDFNDQIQNKLESKISRLVSHMYDDKSAIDDSPGDRDEKSSESDTKEITIPSVIIDEPINVDPKQVCKDFLSIESNGVLYRKCVSTSNLTFDDNSNFYSSSDSCFSFLSSSDERSIGIRPRAGSLPPAHTLELPAAINTCSDLIERIGNKFPRLKSKGDRLHRVYKWWHGQYS